jgi:hypothetical protein
MQVSFDRQPTYLLTDRKDTRGPGGNILHTVTAAEDAIATRATLTEKACELMVVWNVSTESTSALPLN